MGEFMKRLKIEVAILAIIVYFNVFSSVFNLSVTYAYDEKAVKAEKTEDTIATEKKIKEITRTSAGKATVNLRNPDNMYYGTTISQIDVATLDNEGYKLAFQIGIDMRNYYNDYIKPLVNNNKWYSNASKFTVTFPTKMFDNNLEINWSAVEGPKSGPVKLQKANAADGVVLCGNSSSNWTSSSYFSESWIYVRVPAKLTADKYDLASKKQSIGLDGTVTVKVADTSLSELSFTTSYSIPVIDSEKGSLQVTSSDNSDVLFENGNWQLKDGTYNVSGTAQDYEGINVLGNATINLNNATILHKTNMLEKYAPAITITSGNVNLVLNGENTVEGNSGYAGIYIASDASLTISGSGVLNAKGGDGLKTYDLPANLQVGSQKKGYVGGGAGIGGNGLLVGAYDDIPILGLVNCFGNITINGGTINATGGGIPNYTNNGAGAGIGAGGTSSSSGMGNISSGNVHINGGTVNAIGGNGQSNSLTGGGAGIGTGGVTGDYWDPYNNNVKVSISGGTINATGTADGAGIGGGANTDGGIIEITGGTIKAIGGYEVEGGEQYSKYGGAGIGGGDCGGVTSITITGGRIYAKAIGTAAGIGSGNSGFVGTNDYVNNSIDYGEINIGGNANITAIGGSDPRKTSGGAGIGAGRLCGFGSISIIDNARIRAYAGPLAQAIGVGSQYRASGEPNKFSVKIENADVWLFNQDTAQSAFWDQEDYSSKETIAIWYTMPDGETFPSENTSTKAYTNGEGEFYWEYDSSKNIKILKNGKSILEAYCEEGLIGNWATFINVPTQTTYKVAYYDKSGNEIKAAETRIAMSGETVTIINDDKTIEGYTFDEDNANNFLEAVVAKDGSTVLKLYFTKNIAPVVTTDSENINRSNKGFYTNPKTGDNSGIYNILFIVSALGLFILNRNKKKYLKKRKKV